MSCGRARRGHVPWKGGGRGRVAVGKCAWLKD